jgi:hypothetical protein
MPELVRRIEYYYAEVANKPGEGRKLLEFLSAHGVNLVAFTAFPIGKDRAQLDFVPEDLDKLRKAAEEAGLKLQGPKKAFMVQGEERTGILIEYHLRLSDAGVNVHAANGCSGGRGRFGYIMWVKPEDYEKAAKTLGI